MIKVPYLLATIAVLSITYVGVSGLSCYQCNSAYDPRCGDPMDPYSLGVVNCTMKKRPEHLPHLEPVLCRKIIQKIYGKIRIVRGCGYLREEELDDKRCVKRSGTHDVQAVYCSCSKDLCNGTSQTQINNYLMLLVSFAIAIAFHC